MAYAINMRSAAQRHFRDAELLSQNSCYDTAGYHYGFSAECALKGAMMRVGIPIDDAQVNGRPAYFRHFPDLKQIPTQFAGRLSQTIAQLLARASFLQNWHITMRYSRDYAVNQNQCETWRDQVRLFNDQCGGI